MRVTGPNGSKENEYDPGRNKTWIRPGDLVSEANSLRLPEWSKVMEIKKILTEGAALGVKGEACWPSRGPNNDSSLLYGARLTASLQTAVKAGLMYGPFQKKDGLIAKSPHETKA
jgi:hypothetical protein